MKKRTENKINVKYQRYVYITVFVLFISLTNTGAYILGESKNYTIDQMKYPLLNPARAYVNQQDLIVNIQPLRDELMAIGENDKNISIYFEFLNTGANIAVNKDSRFWPASLLKLPVSMAVARKVERGDWKWENELVLMASDKNERFGTLYKEPLGSRFTIEELVERTLSESDNTANFVLVRNLEPEEFQDIYNHLGFKEFLSSEGKISAKQYSVMFRSLYNATYLNQDSSEKLLNFLGKTKFSEYAVSGLPKGVSFAHKIGVSDEKNVFLDSGIVYERKRPYIITIMISTKDEEYAKAQMKKISASVYNYIVNYNNKE